MQFAQYYRDYGPMMDGWDHHSWVGGVFGLLFFLLIVALAIYVLRSLAGSHHNHAQTREPLDIAKERYAKGEINKQEFEERKKDLN